MNMRASKESAPLRSDEGNNGESIMAERDTIPADSLATTVWRNFKDGEWQQAVDVSDFIHKNVTPYLGDAEFLAGPTPRTTALWAKLSELFVAERARGVLDVSPIP